jgi:two-component system, sensor histidine kinase
VATDSLDRPILVVDDLPANLLVIETALAPLGWPIVTATSGQAALVHLLQRDFALVILDVQMPEMDGYETATWIRTRARSKHLPIIFVTAHDRDDSGVLLAYRLGAVDFLFKPIVPEILRAKASVFVTLHQHAEQLARERLAREVEVEAKQQLARLNEELAAEHKRKDTFIAILSHELRNPLAPIRTCIDVVRKEYPSALPTSMIDVLDRQTRTLSRLVDDLLDMSRIKANKLELRPERLDFVAFVEATVSTSKPLCDERQHSVVVNLPAESIFVVADQVRLAQVVTNLVNNAARYTPRGGRIEITCGLVDEQAFVRVSDNGIGIPRELQGSIFDMFVQERTASDGSGGLGLGLGLSHHLVGLHNGTISVHSEGHGRGSTFEIRIPTDASLQALVPRTRTGEMEPLVAVVEDKAVIRTVIVDDNEDAREMLATLLRSQGFEVGTAADGPSGLDLIRDQQPDVALVDLGLPGLDGLGVASALVASLPRLPTKLIALTGYGDQADQARTSAAGFHAHLVKPATASAIFDCIRNQLAKRS